ncbi:MAG: hypothetical protein GDA50_04065 [Alphaproteobacteria bacterium GM202ARS2]|nr:hypothetical protein [Alphaproteobacteria bacterium GM202ARS2]
MTQRDYIPYPERLAAALAELLPEDVRNDLRARQVPAKDVIALFEADHNVAVKLGGPGKWWNLTYMRPKFHKVKSRHDRRMIAQAGRYERLHLTGTKRTEAQQRTYRPIASRPFPTKQERRAFLAKINRKQSNE